MDTPYRQFADADLSNAAQRLGLSVDELHAKLTTALQQPLHGQPATLSITDSGAVDGASCKDIDFDIKIFSVKGKVCFTPGSNWNLSIDLTLYLAGIEVANVKYNFSPSNTQVCYNYDILIGSLKVCFGVRGPNACLFTSGTACAFGSCTSWDETIVCFL
jgi:hypothetical protein